MSVSGVTGRSVLVVDDEDVFRRSLVEGLAAELPGVELFTADNGLGALDVLERQVVDLVVTDVSMPQMDGMALVAEMISRGIRLPVVMVTAFGNRGVENNARRHGVIEVLDKPIDFAQLVELCRNTLRSLGRGGLGGVTLAGLLQLLEMERRSCTVRVFCAERSGRIHLDHGRIVGCTEGEVSGATALKRILAWSDPSIEMAPLRRKERGGKPISLQAALLDAARHEDELSRLSRDDDDDDDDDDEIFDIFDFEETGSGLLVLPTEDDAAPDEAARDETPRHPAVHSHDERRRKEIMANIEQTITSAMEIQGAVAAALVDYESGMSLGAKANGFPIEIAAAGNTEVIRSKMRVMGELGLEGRIHDILITLDTQYHLLMPLRQGSLFLYMAIDRNTGNLAMARHKLTALEKDLVV